MVILSGDAAASIAAEAPASADGRETGGILLGHDLGRFFVVTIAGGPGPQARRRADCFLRDLGYARWLGDIAYDRDGSVWIGEWHTHPVGPPHPSPTDMATYDRLLSDRELGFDRVLSLIVTSTAPGRWRQTNVHGTVKDRDGLTPIQVRGYVTSGALGNRSARGGRVPT